MKSIRSWLKCLAIGVAFLTNIADVAKAQQTIPSGCTFQGFLEYNGQPLNGSHQLDIFWKDTTDAVSFFGQTIRNTTVRNGLFDVVLGENFPSTMLFTIPYDLHVTVDGTNTIPPIRVYPSPYALGSLKLGGMDVTPIPVAGSLFSIPAGSGYKGPVKIDPAFLPLIPANLLQEPPLKSINLVSADTSHDIQFVAGSNMTVTPNQGGHSVTLSTTSGEITGVSAGAGLQDAGNVTLSVAPGGISSSMLAPTLQIGSSTSTSTPIVAVAAEVSGGSAVIVKGGIGANNPTGSSDGTGLSPGVPQTFWSDQVSVPSTTTTLLTIYNALISTSSTIVLLPVGSSPAVSNLVITSQSNGSFIIGSSTNMGTGVGGSVTAINYMVVNH